MDEAQEVMAFGDESQGNDIKLTSMEPDQKSSYCRSNLYLHELGRNLLLTSWLTAGKMFKNGTINLVI